MNRRFLILILIILSILIGISSIGCNLNKEKSEDIKNTEKNESSNNNNKFDNEYLDKSNSPKDNKNKSYDSLEEAIKKSKRVNVLVLGREKDPRTDTMILATFDTKNKKIDLISIPRDTYFHEKGYNTGDHRKINAAYARDREKGAMKAVEAVLGVPIDYYVTVRYAGVEKIVDSLGGVEATVPKWFETLHKNKRIPSGTYVLNGEQSVKFLRFRDKYRNGDIGRVESQQAFIKSALKKALGFKLPAVVKATFDAVETDMSLTKSLYYTYKVIGIDTDDINMTILPGKASFEYVGGRGWSYFRYDEEKTKELIEGIYNVKDDEEN